MPSPETKSKLRFFAGFAVYFAVLLWLWDTPVLYPLKIFVVMLHEISHGAVAVATGGTIEHIQLDPRQGGACYCPGGNAFLTLSAGYLGSLAWGLFLLAAAGARHFPPPSVVLAAAGAAVVVLTLFYVDGSFGVAFGLAFGAALMLAAWMLGPRTQRPILMTLGLTSCVYAILDIKSDVLDRPELRSDARMLAEYTGISTVTWGVLWITVAALVSFLALRRAYQRA